MLEIIVLGILIIFNGFFALSEIALVSSKRPRLEQAALEGQSGASVALRLLGESENFLSAIQVGITLIGIITGVYGGLSIADDVMPYFQDIEMTRLYARELAISLTVIIITYISILIGELVPKTIALSNPERIAAKVAPVIYYFSKVFYPFVKLLSISTFLINSILGIKKQTQQVTEAELRQMIRIASHEGVIEKEQNLIHEKVFYFADKKAKHIMTHRKDVEWIDIDDSHDEIKAAILNFQHSKIICCRGTLDNFQGIFDIRDYFKAVQMNKNVKIQDISSPPLIIPENASAQRVLDEFRNSKTHFCVVVSEHGSFEGVISLHDIMENIVGDIPDEGETFEPDVFVRDDNTVLVSGDAAIETLVDIIEGFVIDFDEIDYSTVAGFVFNKINKIPRLGDKFEFMGHYIEIVDMDGNRIDKVLIQKMTS